MNFSAISRHLTRPRAAIAIATVAAASVAVSLSLTHGAASVAANNPNGIAANNPNGIAANNPNGIAANNPNGIGGPLKANLIASSCGGPAGAAYVADAGWDGFSAIDTANCKIIQTYNVGDPQVPGDPGDYNYASTDEGIALHGSTLYFADTGDSSIAVIDAATLDPTNYNPPETDIHTGTFPQDLAVTPDGSQLWVANTGPQTQADSPTSVSVIDTATKKVTATIATKGSPTQVAFSPDGSKAYVVTSAGLWTFSTRSLKVTGFLAGLGEPHSVAVAPDGTLYITDTNANAVKVISPAGQVTATIGVGDLPWDIVVAADGKTAYVANPDSDTVSVISTAANAVTATVSVPGDPDTLGLTPDGSQLWIGQASLAYVTLLDTKTATVVGSLNLGGSAAQSGDGYEPTGIVLTKTPTPGS